MSPLYRFSAPSDEGAVTEGDWGRDDNPTPASGGRSPDKGGQTEKEGYPMRLDKYLKVSRLIKRRPVANEACDNGLISVNGKPQRASYDVKVGDKITLRLGLRELTVEVVSVQETVRQADAATLYKEVK